VGGFHGAQDTKATRALPPQSDETGGGRDETRVERLLTRLPTTTQTGLVVRVPIVLPETLPVTH
jgi:hypothetical protein